LLPILQGQGIPGAAAGMAAAFLWTQTGGQMTPDDLTIAEKVLSASPPGAEWVPLILFGLLLAWVVISEGRRR